MFSLKSVVPLCLFSLLFNSASSQQLTKIDESANQVLYSWENDFLAFKYAVKSDSIYKPFFDKNYVLVSEFRKIYLSTKKNNIPVEEQKLSNTSLPKINIEFIEIVKASANKYKIAFKYWQGNNVNTPHYYCLEVECDKNPDISPLFFQEAKRVGGIYCGDEY